MHDTIKVVDLFCGCGGLSLGLQESGFDIVAAVDNWHDALRIYKANFDHPVYQHDLSDVSTSIALITRHHPDMIVGGPPCQDFSHAGKRKENDRADLTVSFAKIIESIKPQWFVMENVDRAQNSVAYATARQIFKALGYGLNERVLDASLCDVPQKRKRFFCVGHLGDRDGFLDVLIDQRIGLKPLTVRAYLGSEFGIEHYYRHPRNYCRRGIYSIDEPSPTVRGVNRPVPKGYIGHNADPIKISELIRPLTTLERARLQTFPKDFKWSGTKTTLEQMIGNAVPVNLAAFIGQCIQRYVSEMSFSATMSSGL